MAFEMGDIVQLLSGGPHMVVDDIIDGPRAKCVWFSNDLRQEGYFKFETIKKVEA